jgi:tetratricopeptide (TPR) repeat protein
LKELFFFIAGGVLLPSFFLCSDLCADAIKLKNGKELKGLVVEEHEDRILLSTENGEIPVLRRGIRQIDFDNPAQNFAQVGRSFEEKQRWGEAMAYYEKALEVNPDLEEAKNAVARVRNRFWAKTALGPVDEIEKRQALYETWGKGNFSETRKGPEASAPTELLHKDLGLRLLKKGDWVRLSEVIPGKDAALSGLRKNDRLVSIDGNSLRYLNVEAVREKLMSPRHTSFILEYDRECHMARTGFEKELREFGLELKLDTQGVVVTGVKPSSAASRSGFHKNDTIIEVNSVSTRYLPLKKFMDVIQKNPAAVEAVFIVRRSALLTRR